MRRAWLALIVPLLFAPRAAWPQGGIPQGPEFRVNTYTPSEQQTPVVAADPAGNFVVVWASWLQDGSWWGVFGQRYASSGIPLGSEFRVNSFTGGPQYEPSVAADTSGNFVVVWDNGIGFDVFGQRYAGDGTPVGPEFQVNTYTAGAPGGSSPAVAADPAGNFVVVWSGGGQGYTTGIFGQRYASSGVPLGAQFQVNSSPGGPLYRPTVAADSAGSFVVAWIHGQYMFPPVDVVGRRFASDGTALGPEFRINTFTTGGRGHPAVAASSGGGFVVVWAGQGQGDSSGIFGQRFGSSGAPVGPEFRLNSYTTDFQSFPSVAADSAGNFVVAWTSENYGGSMPPDVVGQRYASDGTPLGAEFRINSYTTDQQRWPAVASGPSGSFVVVWDSLFQDGSGSGVFGQRYNQIVPVELMHFRVE